MKVEKEKLKSLLENWGKRVKIVWIDEFTLCHKHNVMPAELLIYLGTDCEIKNNNINDNIVLILPGKWMIIILDKEVKKAYELIKEL